MSRSLLCLCPSQTWELCRSAQALEPGKAVPLLGMLPGPESQHRHAVGAGGTVGAVGAVGAVGEGAVQPPSTCVWGHSLFEPPRCSLFLRTETRVCSCRGPTSSPLPALSCRDSCPASGEA